MPWIETDALSERTDFILRSQEPGANFAALCREYGISRKTGYKWRKRWKERGFRGLREMDRGVRPGASPLACTAEMALAVVEIRRIHPTWGAKKIHAVLKREHPGEDVPSRPTIGRILKREGLTEKRPKRRRKVGPGKRPEVVVEAPNDLWTADFKGWWSSLGGRRCEPLTVRDAFSKKVLAVHLVAATSIEEVRAVFEDLFRRYGMPKAILTDNGPPFAANNSKVGLTKLSAWWVALGIRWHRSRPGCPQDNGAHERMHRDMKAELQLSPEVDLERQQVACERWRRAYNAERPHEALGMKVPNDVYRRSRRPFPEGELQLVYPEAFKERRVTSQGTVRFHSRPELLSRGLAGQTVAFERLVDGRVRVWYARFCLGVAELPWTGELRPPGRGVETL